MELSPRLVEAIARLLSITREKARRHRAPAPRSSVPREIPMERTDTGGLSIRPLSRYERAKAGYELMMRYAQRYFDETKHPRAAAGQPTGGQWIAKHSDMEWLTADLDRRISEQAAKLSDEFRRSNPTPKAVNDGPPLGPRTFQTPPNADLAEYIRYPEPETFESESGREFMVSFEPAWKYAPAAGLHVPALDPDDVEDFLDIAERAAVVWEAIDENAAEIEAVNEEIRWRNYRINPDMREVGARRDELFRERSALMQPWSELEAEYRKLGFNDKAVTGFREGVTADRHQYSSTIGNKGLRAAALAYLETQKPRTSGPGVEPTGDEALILVAAAEAAPLALRLGSAAIRGGYRVAKVGTRYVLRKRAASKVGGTTGQGLRGTAFSQEVRAYIHAIERHTGFRLHPLQRKALIENLRKNSYGRLPPGAGSDYRAKNFTTAAKNAQIAEWERQTGQVWPRYTRDVRSPRTGWPSRKIGDLYDAHHIIENAYWGPHEWWNLTPARFPDQHQRGLHLEEIVKKLFP